MILFLNHCVFYHYLVVDIFLIIFYILFIFNTNSFSNENNKKLKVGLLAPLSGPYGEVGNSLLYSLQLALEEINDKNVIRINSLIWFDGKENSPQIQEYFSPSDVKNISFYKKLNWDRKENNDGWEFGGDWEHQINKNNSFKLRVVLTEDNEDENDISFLKMSK